MRKMIYKKLGLFVLFLTLAMQANGQGRIIRGTVTDDKGEPIPGTTVAVKGTSIGTVADMDGNYSINAPDAGVLVFSFIGFQTREITIGNQTTINVQLAQQVSDLGEVVVVGYGVQRKSDLTGSVSSVGEREIKQVAVASLDQALQGRAAGVQVTQASAAPGGGVSIRIRGGNSINASNEPLYVIDGIPFFPNNATVAPGTSGGGQPQNALANINPGDIESMEILKDASATAIYGSRGANGVVIITTKRGKAGATNVDFESYYGVQQVSRTIPLLNAEEFAIIANEARVGRGQSPIFSAEQIASFRNNSTDWQSEVFRDAPIQNHQVTVSGGDAKTRFAISGNYFNQEGVILNSGFSRGSVRVNLDKTINNKVTVGNSLTISRATNNQQVTDITRGGVVNAALVFSPTLPVFDADGNFTFDNSSIPGSQQVGNPVQDALETLNKTVTNRVLGNVFMEWKVIDNLLFRASGGVDFQTGRRDFYAPSTNNRGRNAFGSALVETKNVFSPVGTFTLNYDKKFDKNSYLILLAGYESQSQMVDFVGAQATNFPTDALGSDNLGLGQIVGTPFSGRSLWRLDSWFGRVNYTLFEKFLFTGTFRADGSSRFGAGNKWGYFPSAAVGYNMSNEPFVNNIKWLSTLKVTTSWGLTGNQEIGLYQSLSQLNTERNAFGNVIAIGLAPGRIPNPDLRWEKTNQVNVGLEVGLIEDRIFFEAAGYYKRTQDLLLPLDLPRSTGFATILTNIGSVENKGLELSVNSNNLTGKLKWVTNANITFNRNTVLALGPGETFRLAPGTGDGHLQIANSSILQVGAPVGSFFGMVTNGIIQSGEQVIPGSSSFGSVGPGDIRYVDVNGDGRIDNNDRTIIGNPQPKFFYGMNNNFTYKNFDLSIFINGTYGNDVWNVNSHELYRNDGATNNVRGVLNRWTPENPSNEWPSSRTRPFVLSDRHIENASFLRVRNVTLGYNLPVGNVTWLRSCRVYLQGQNILTFTNYSGFDPEVNSLGQNPIGIGIDRGTFPMARSFIMGVNFGL
ncbi:SusC/RagA family TonB-linked outer membrane protein [Cecembia calidifontis]|jgi:TonB-linked SusC/RagA family outer membrane protein|uniref:TonB-linked SusC/RagA family outer membrane protein n=1 Tax=Cecembia calidifontis TaxID=1187080 RepID=A0A4Q7P8U7_9BACT|nr:TonB-dependent receptor [Cecembia calidifontis]RZS95988.1 TonB-linked SusC/RagA family outer membrane protein [Cecembia calidifontis]